MSSTYDRTAEGSASNKLEQASSNDFAKSSEPDTKHGVVDPSVKEAENEDISMKDELIRLTQRLLEVEQKASHEKNEREKLEQIVRLGGDPGQGIEDVHVYEKDTVKWLEHRRNRMVVRFRERYDEVKREERRMIAEFARTQEEINAELETAKKKAEAAPYVKAISEQMKAAGKPVETDGETAEKVEDDAKEEPSPEEERSDAEPKLNRVEWPQWQTSKFSSRRYAIDVLEGEPVVNIEPSSSYWMSAILRPGSKHQLPASNPPPTKKDEVPGKGPLPERIRINSDYIIRFLRKVFSRALTEGDILSSSVIMIRPFKGLVFHEKDIRRQVQAMEERMAKNSESSNDHGKTEAAGTDEQTKPKHLETGATPDESQPEGSEAVKPEDELEDSPEALQHLKCLLEFMDTYIQAKRDYLASEQCQQILFNDIWYLFSPGVEIVDGTGRQAYRIIGITSPNHKAYNPWRNFWMMRHRGQEQDTQEVKPITLYCVYLDYDGVRIGPVQRKFEIPHFEGHKPVNSLEVYPLRFARDAQANLGRSAAPAATWADRSYPQGHPSLRDKLMNRGRMFLSVAMIKHMHYNGPTLDTGEDVDGQVVIDFEEACTNLNVKVVLEETLIMQPPWKSTEPSKEDRCQASCCSGESLDIHHDSYSETKRNESYLASLMPETPSQEPSVTIYPKLLDAELSGTTLDVSPEELLIFCDRVYGFVLRSRKWAVFDLDHLTTIGQSRSSSSLPGGKENVASVASEEHLGPKIRVAEDSHYPTAHGDNIIRTEMDNIPKRETAFDQLVLPEKHKDIVVSLVAQHYRDKESAAKDYEQVDIVRGKGKGLIILLHGAPGVGKTTTAEGVAELFEKPLYQITCGDLGTTAQDVEKAMNTTFALASRWGCILLLDEAEVFLAARTPHDFTRNGLVSVFLRVLEYYNGILFLTTNRIGDFDEAFISRIHISLHYPQLDYNSTLEVFKLNLRLIRERFKVQKRRLTVDEEGILQQAAAHWEARPSMRWNGRQIRNACQTALALAEFDAQGSSIETIKHADAEVQLTVRQLDIVCLAYQDFLTYLKDISGFDSDQRAKLVGIRAKEKKGPSKGLRSDGKPDLLQSDKSSQVSLHGLRDTASHPNPPQPVMNPQQPSSSAAPQAPAPMGGMPSTHPAYLHQDPAMPAPATTGPGMYSHSQGYYPAYNQPPWGYMPSAPQYAPQQGQGYMNPAEAATHGLHAAPRSPGPPS